MLFKKLKSLFDITENCGFSEDEISQAERKLAITLPSVLRQYYLELGKHHDLNQTENTLLLPNQLKIEDDFLIFYDEYQYVMQWGVKKEDLAKSNPAVYARIDDEWALDTEQVSDFLFSMALLQATVAFPFNANISGSFPDAVKTIETNWNEIETFSPKWKTRFFQNHVNEIIAVMGNEEEHTICVAAKSEAIFENIDDILELDWHYYSGDDDYGD